ncbi:MAG TPA: alpha/beta fold hydrolase [Bryobacteraceae bacterium]|nr:alpha/beta fold hydrolase [Bryobacteraceae bacterium]
MTAYESRFADLHRRGSRIRSTQTPILVLGALLALSACAPLAQVREIRPSLGAQHGTLPQLRHAEQAIAEGDNLQRADPTRAIGFYLSGVESATSELRKDPNDRVALHDYDFALSRVFSVIHDAHLDPWTRPLHVPAPNGGQYLLTHRAIANRLWRPQDYELIPADELDLRGKFVVPRVTREGAGAALVAVRSEQAPQVPLRFAPPRVYTAVTAVARFTGRKCEIEFIDPLATETVNVSGRSLPSQADLTAPIALGLSREHPEKIGFAAMLNPEKFAHTARLVQVQPYAPNKIPVLFVHGLQDTPVSWVPMVSALWSDPVLRRNYQVCVFSYPSGYPFQYSALVLRRELDTFDRTFPHHRPIILVGHSMGGIISRLMITDSGGDKVWRYFFAKPPTRTKLSPETKALLEEALIFTPRRDVARVIFISTPHRGSILAQNSIGRIGSSLIRKSMRVMNAGPEILRASVVQEDPTVLKLNRLPNSIDTLSPNDPFLKEMNTLSMAKRIPYHSIIGDRGRGDTPNSSDGVVPYWSSHLEGAESEKIVPSGHGAEHSAQGIAEVVRILHEHIASRGSGKQPRPGLRRTEMPCDTLSGNGSFTNLSN